MGEDLDGFLEELCFRTQLLWAIFMVAVTLVVFQIPFLLVGTGGDAVFVVSTMNLVGFVAFAVGSSVTIRYCRRRQRRE